jgi:RNA-binding protein
MNVVGRAVSTFGKRMLVIRCEAAQLPGLYSEVLDRNMNTVGMIVDLFGNVKEPYAAVVCRGCCSVRPEEKLYAKVQAKPGKDREMHRKQQVHWKQHKK